MTPLTRALISSALTALLFFALSLQVAYPPSIAQVYAAGIGGLIVFLTRCRPLFDDSPAKAETKEKDSPKFPPMGVLI